MPRAKIGLASNCFPFLGGEGSGSGGRRKSSKMREQEEGWGRGGRNGGRGGGYVGRVP